MRKNLLFREISHVAQSNNINYENDPLLGNTGQGYVRFPSGESLSIVTAKTDTGEGEKHYDPLNSGIPLLHVSEGDSEKFLSKSFQVKEFLQFGEAKAYKSERGVEPDRSKLRLDPKLVEVLQKLRDHLNKSIKINSGYRHFWYNKIVDGKKQSQHLIGRAVDIVVDGMTPLQVAKAAIDAAGADIFGIGIYGTFTHIDVRCGTFAAFTRKNPPKELEENVKEILKYRKSKNLPNQNSKCGKPSKANPPEIKSDKPLPASLSISQFLPAVIHAAELIRNGNTNADEITDKVFYRLYPEQKRPLEKGNTLAGVWLFLRENVVQPVLDKDKGINKTLSTIKVEDSTVKKIINDTEIMEAFHHANKLTGVPINYLMVFAYIESRGNQKIGTNSYGYTGLMQVGQDATSDIIRNFPEAVSNGVAWKEVIKSVKINVLAAAYYMKLNRKRLDKSIPDDVLHTYLAHQQGAGGLKRLIYTLKINPNTKANKNQLNNLPTKFIISKGGPEHVTINDFYEYYKKRIGDIATQFKKYTASLN